jgi:hypothetical protein
VKITESFSYQFEDIQWPTKLGLGAIISLVPILNFAIAGYEVVIIRNVAAGSEEPLPSWDDFGQKFRDGLLLTLAGLIYAAPALILICLPLALLAASAALSQNGAVQGFARPLNAANALLLTGALILALFYSLLLSVLRPIILVLFSREGTFASCFQLGEILRVIKRWPRIFFTTWVVLIAAGVATGLFLAFANLVIGWIPCAGWVASLLLGLGTAMYLITIDGYIFGQFRLEAFERSMRSQQSPPETQQNPGDLSS